MKLCKWGDLAKLEYGKSLRSYSAETSDSELVRVYGTNGPIGWCKEPLRNQAGIIIGRKGAYRGVHYSPSPFFVIDTAYFLSLTSNDVDLRWAYYQLLTVDINRLDSGSAIPSTKREDFYSIPVRVPSKPSQLKIASILSAYDDLIENNLKRIALLEESARLLYREWFVWLRFPGYEHTRIVDGVPEGWERKTLAEVCESVSYGYTASAQSEEVGPKFLRITDIVPQLIDWSSVPNCEIPDDKKKQYLLKDGDIVIARTGATVGYAKRLHKRHPEAVFASYLIRLRLKPEVDDLLVGTYVESDDYKNFVKAHVGGAAQPNANAKVLSSARLLMPPPTLQGLFRENVEAIQDQKEVLMIQNQKLKQARDLLLPRLMNGEIEV
ncbi:MAG: restriction endonuclease subunit S [Acidobacteriota bacterium]